MQPDAAIPSSRVSSLQLSIHRAVPALASAFRLLVSDGETRLHFKFPAAHLAPHLGPQFD